MKKIIIIVAIVLVVAAICAGAYLWFGPPAKYYTQIDNTKISETVPGTDMPYVYTLDCYDENGTRTSHSFKTYRELREGAYLCLKVLPVRGVIEWVEMDFGELPGAVQSKFASQ